MKKIVVLTLVLLAIPVVLAISGNGEIHRMYVTGNPAGRVVAKGLFGTRHEFPEGFSVEVTSNQLKVLKKIPGVIVQPVQLYHIIGKPGCECDNDGVCEPELMEHPSCCNDCKGGVEEPVPSCEPGNQIPWGVSKVNGGSGGAEIDVAVLDTGAMKEHSDLYFTYCKDVTKGPRIKNTCKDGDGHGTHVAGTIAANGKILGVAPEANLMIIKVLNDQGSGWSDDIAYAIRMAANNGAEIISMSLGGPYSQDIIYAVDYAVDNKGVLIVAAAGNSGPSEDSIIYPAAYYKVMGIAAIEEDETVPNFSSRGLSNGDGNIDERELDLAAPGVSIESTWNDGCYFIDSGTSMAAPHVSGLAAKLWQGSSSATRDYLDFTIAKNLYSEGHDIYTGFGLPIVS